MKEIVLGIVRKEDKILVINRAKRLKIVTRPCPVHCSRVGNWAFPGGKIEPGESRKRAVVREVGQEVGIRVKVGNMIAIRGIPRTSVKAIYFECVPTRNQRIRRVPNREALEAYWVPAAIVPDLFGPNNMDRGVIEWLQEIAQGKNGTRHQRVSTN